MKYLTPFFLFAALAACILAIWFTALMWQLLATAAILFVAAVSVTAARQNSRK